MKHKIGSLLIEISSLTVMVVAMAVAGADASVGSRDLPNQVTTASSEPQLLAEGFMRKLQDAKMDKIAGELEKDPKLIDDPDYLKQHPKLADYLKKNPDAKQKIKADPKGFFQHLKDANRA